MTQLTDQTGGDVGPKRIESDLFYCLLPTFVILYFVFSDDHSLGSRVVVMNNSAWLVQINTSKVVNVVTLCRFNIISSNSGYIKLLLQNCDLVRVFY